MEHQNKSELEPPAAPEPPEAEAEADAGESAGRPAVRRRPRGATAVLLAVASVVGVVGGTAVGYGVQAEREPTPLPALSQPGLAYPAKPLPANQRPKPLTAAEDNRVKTEGDLRKLLLPKPAGARSIDAEWLDDGEMDLRLYTRWFEDPQNILQSLTAQDMRRGAGARWTKGDRTWAVNLVQFPDYERGAAFVSDHVYYMPEYTGGDKGEPLPNTERGLTFVYKVQKKAGYKPLYETRALFQRGTIMADIQLYDSKPISRQEIRTLAQQQWERL
ncbi:hypothetical protein [Streptomyces sp. NPDC047315]|uniref:hypothetical protein n=1 Tax=Streptomyces sp. NPDC047315 TaxID=3155142 RepID=UPI0033E0362C